jgi:hypothetical protein
MQVYLSYKTISHMERLSSGTKKTYPTWSQSPCFTDVYGVVGPRDHGQYCFGGKERYILRIASRPSQAFHLSMYILQRLVRSRCTCHISYTPISVALAYAIICGCQGSADVSKLCRMVLPPSARNIFTYPSISFAHQ